METAAAAAGFKALTSSTTISLAPSQPSNSETIIVSASNAPAKQQQHQQQQQLRKAPSEQAPFRRPSNLTEIPAPAVTAMNNQQSPSEFFLITPTSTSSIESNQNHLAGPTHYPHFSGVDNLILAAKIQACSKQQTSYSDYITAYYQQQFLQHQQQQQVQQQQQQQQQQMRDGVIVNPMTSRGSQPIVNFDNYPNNQPMPMNQHELELYLLLKGANLLEYFGRFIRFGGDDVRQLAEADEQEFVEIMELVEMNRKPLHMRRMQKALNEWRQDREEYLEANENSKKYIAHNDSIFYVDKVAQEYPSQHNTSFRSTPSLYDSTAPTSTGVARSLFPNESANISNNIPESPQQQYNTPLEVIKNAPKKPRLMDNIKPSDLTKGIQLDENGPIGSTPKKVRPKKPLFCDHS